MHTLHQYVPIKNDDVLEKSAVHKVLLGGDQLTAARARGCRDLRISTQILLLDSCRALYL